MKKKEKRMLWVLGYATIIIAFMLMDMINRGIPTESFMSLMSVAVFATVFVILSTTTIMWMNGQVKLEA